LPTNLFINSTTGINFFTTHLQTTIDPEIRREQGKKLLSKFLKVGVFKNVENPQEEAIKEKGIYRLTIARGKPLEKTPEEICFGVFLGELKNLNHTLSTNTNSTHIHQNITSKNNNSSTPS